MHFTGESSDCFARNRLNWLPVLLSLFLCLAGAIQVLPWAKEYRLELTVTTDKDDEFVLMVEIDTRQLRKLENDSFTEIQPYLVQARRDYAHNIGYRKEIYGDENYKMVKIISYYYTVREISSGRVVLKK